jgi:CrcB protein
MVKILLLSVGGAIGTVARYLLDGASHRMMGDGFPYGTLVVNVLGCFLLGLFVSSYDGHFAQDHLVRFFLIVGFCGAFTTFSTFILQTAELVNENMPMLAMLNVVLSILAGLIFFVIGIKTGKLF